MDNHYKLVTIEDLKSDEIICKYVVRANEYLAVLGFTDHGMRHVELVSQISANVMRRLGRSDREVQMAGIAGFLHDIGNVCGRDHHEQSGALLCREMLARHSMPDEEIMEIMLAIGNHEERTGTPINAVGSALILGDKTDVHRSRVQNRDRKTFDIHDKVNYAVTKSFLDVENDTKQIILRLTIDTSEAEVMQYFELFMDRMLMNKRAAEFLGCHFTLEINGMKMF